MAGARHTQDGTHFAEFTVSVRGTEPHEKIADAFEAARLRFVEMNEKVVSYSHRNQALVTAVRNGGDEWKVTVLHGNVKTVLALKEKLETAFKAIERAN